MHGSFTVFILGMIVLLILSTNYSEDGSKFLVPGWLSIIDRSLTQIPFSLGSVNNWRNMETEAVVQIRIIDRYPCMEQRTAHRYNISRSPRLAYIESKRLTLVKDGSRSSWPSLLSVLRECVWTRISLIITCVGLFKSLSSNQQTLRI